MPIQTFREERLSEAERDLRRILSFYLNWHNQLPDDFDDESHAQDLEETIAALNYVRRYLWDRLPACVNIPF